MNAMECYEAVTDTPVITKGRCGSVQMAYTAIRLIFFLLLIAPGRWGVHDANAYQQLFEYSPTALCPSVKALPKQNPNSKVYWVRSISM